MDTCMPKRRYRKSDGAQGLHECQQCHAPSTMLYTLNDSLVCGDCLMERYPDRHTLQAAFNKVNALEVQV